MAIITDALAQRTTSAYPVSIGTSLALESIGKGPLQPYDPDREIPQHIDLTQYDQVWINVLTLFRNIIGAMPSDAILKVSATDVMMTLEFEADLINRLVHDESHGRAKAVFYVCKYADLKKVHPYAKLRVDSTERQRMYTLTMENCINAFMKGTELGSRVRVYERSLRPPEKHKTLIFTHYAYDLLSAKRFETLDLLESHTGVLKKESARYTKLHGGKDLPRIPFRVCFMQVFGDSQTFHPWPILSRKAVLKLAEDYKWTTHTTNDRLRLSFDQLEDQALSAALLDMLSEDKLF